MTFVRYQFTGGEAELQNQCTLDWALAPTPESFWFA